MAPSMLIRKTASLRWLFGNICKAVLTRFSHPIATPLLQWRDVGYGKSGLQALIVVESNLFHKSIQHALLAGAVEVDGELVPLDGSDIAVAELDVEDAVADEEF